MPVPYMNPYYFQNNPAYQPQQQYNPMAPYQDRLAQLQSQYNQQSQYNLVQQNQTYGLNGEIVDGIDVVKAKNVDMSGNVTFYPKADMSEIYTKQLMADGTSRIVIYKAVHPENQKTEPQQQAVTLDMLNAMLGQLKMDLLQDIGNGLSEIKGMITVPETPKTTRGGTQK